MKNVAKESQKSYLLRIIGKIPTYFLIFILILLGLSLYRNMVSVKAVGEKIAKKEKELEEIRNEQEELQKKLEFTKSQEYMETQLRDRLGLAKEGEIVVIMPPPEVLRSFAPKHYEEEDALPDPNWKKWLKLFI